MQERGQKKSGAQSWISKVDWAYFLLQFKAFVIRAGFEARNYPQIHPWPNASSTDDLNLYSGTAA